MSITLDGLEFELSDFVGTDGLGHATVQPATTGASGESYPAEALFPERIFRAALNQLGQGLYSTSTSSVAIGTGSKAFTLATSVQITDGAFVLVTDQANDANYVYGQVTSVVGLVYTVNVTATGGSGTIAAWNFQVSGVQGVAGSVSDGDKGDITVSTSGTVWTIDNGAVTEAKQTLADNTTNNASTSKHGYLKKLSNVSTEFMNGVGEWATPSVNAPQPSKLTGRYYANANFATTANDAIAVVADRLYAFPVFIASSQAFTAVAVNPTAGSGNMRAGLYADTSGAPGALITDYGTVSVAGTGMTNLAITATLAGWYWIGLVFSGTPTLRSVAAVDILPTLGVATSNTIICYSYVAHTYGALPNPFGSPTHVGGASTPWVGLKV